MAINKKLIHFQTEANFNSQLAAGNILDTSICFIQDANKIWTHGTFYGISNVDLNNIEESIAELIDGKVDKVSGKGLSTNDFTTTLKNKLDGIASGAEVNVQSDWTQTDSTKDSFIKNKPTLAKVATSGSYTDLSNKPTVDTALSTTSTNAVQNKIVTASINAKLNIEDAADTYATKKELGDVQSELQNQIDTLVSGDSSEAIESFNEIVAFLNGVEDTETIEGIIAGINTEIAKKADKSAAITNITRSGNTFTATRADGSTFTFTQKDNDTTYTFANGSSGNFTVTPSGGSAQTVSIGKPATAGTADKADKLSTARAIDGVNFNGESAITHYGECSTAAATAEKAVSLSNFTLVKGAKVAIKFTVTNSAANPTLNINGTGAKAIMYRGSAIKASYLATNRVYEFVYDGTDYELVGDINTDTNTKVTSASNHYAPTADDNSALSVDASSSTAATWGTTSLVTGVNLQRDSKGHVTGVTVDSIKMPSNPNSNTTYTFTGGTNKITVDPSNADPYDVTITPSISKNVTYTGTLIDEQVATFEGTSGQIKASGYTIASSVPSNAKFTDTTYSAATTSADGLMSASDKAKLDGIQSGADAVSFTQSLTSGTKVGTLNINGTNTDLYAPTNTNTTYSFTGGTNKFTVTPSGGTAQEVTVTPSIANNVTYTGTLVDEQVATFEGTSGQVKASGYTIGKSVPNNAVFTDTVPSAYCSTAAATAAKTASCSGYTLTANTYLHLIVTKANTSQSALTLNVNGKGAKNLYINGSASSSSNYTLPAGSYIVFYDGTQYQLRTDGVLPGKILSASNSDKVNGLTVQTAVPANAKFTDTNTHYTSKNIVGASSSATANATADNGSVYLNHLEESTVKSTHLINGTGATTVTSDSSGNITINSTDTKVTAVGNHYTPAEDTNAAISAASGTATNITGTAGKLNVVTGLKRDAKGHIVGVTSANIYSTDNNSTQFTITATATDDDVIVLTGTNGTNKVTFDAKHAKKFSTSDATYTSGNSTTSISGSGGTIKIPQITVDSYGHVTAAADESVTITMPSVPVTSVAGKTGKVELGKGDVGLGNVTNESKSTMFTSAALTGTPTAPTAASGTNSTQIATTAFVQSAIDSKLAANDAMIFKGTIGSSNATVSALPNTHNAGWTYKVITAGTYAGVSCEIGDMIICIKDGTAASNSDWTVIQSNIDGSVTGPASAVDARVAVFNGTTGKVIKDSGYTIASSVPANAKFTDTDTHYTTGIVAGGSGATANASATNPYVAVKDNSTYRSQIRLVGGGATTVSSDANGNITISSTDTWRSISDSVSSTSSDVSASSKAVKTAYDLAASKTSNTGTVTSVTPGTGLTGTSSDAAITSTGTINLKSAATGEIGGIKVGTVNSSAVTTKTEGSNYYPVNIDSNSKAYVALPTWSNNSGTITGVTAGNGLTGGGSSGSVTLNVGAGTGISVTDDAVGLATSGVTAGSYGPSANATPAHSGTFSVPYLTVDSYGRVTAASTKTITLPSPSHSADYITGGYLNIHPENSPTLIPFIHNDIAHLLKRGGSAVIKYDSTTKTDIDISAVFDGSPSYWSINPTGVTTITIELTLHKAFTWPNTIYVDFGAYDWRAKSIKIEVINTNYANDVWTQKANTTSNGSGHYAINMSHTPVGANNAGGGFNKIRFTFSSWANSTSFRIAALGVYNYGSLGLRETFIPRDGGVTYGGLYPHKNNTYNLGTSSNKWATVYATSFSGSGASLTSLNASNISSGTIAADRLPDASTSAKGAMTATMVTKLNGIATGATKVTTDTVSGWGYTKNAGTVTSITLKSGTGISVDSSNAITSSGTRTISLASGVLAAGTAGTQYGPTAAVTGNNNSTINIPHLKVDTYGRVTSVGHYTLTLKNTTYSNMGAATASAAGTAGLVPAPAAGAQAKFLRGDGTWATPTNTTYGADRGISLVSGKFGHSNTAITGATVGTSAATSGSTIAIPYVTYDSYGHITAAGTHTHTVSGFLTSHQTIKQDGITGATVNRYATCSTAAGTAAKTANITTGTFNLEAGARVSVKFSNANTAGTPTLNINSKGAKNIFHKGAQITTGSNKSLLAGIVDFIYDGTQWHLVGNYIDTTYTSKSAANGGTDTSLVTTGEKYTWNNKASTSVATTSANGLMSASDKTKLNSLNAVLVDAGEDASDPTSNNIQTNGTVTAVVAMTRATYEALTTIDPTTLYIITD